MGVFKWRERESPLCDASLVEENAHELGAYEEAVAHCGGLKGSLLRRSFPENSRTRLMQRLGIVMSVARPKNSACPGTAPRALTCLMSFVKPSRAWTMCGFFMVVFLRRMGSWETPYRTRDPWARGWPSSSLGVSSSSSEQVQEDALTATCLDLKESFGGLVNLRGGALRRIF